VKVHLKPYKKATRSGLISLFMDLYVNVISRFKSFFFNVGLYLQTSNFKFYKPNFRWVLITVAILLSQFSYSINPKIQMFKINYKGWSNAIELQNERVRLVIVPQIGRIMHYSFVNDKNVLYENSKLAGLLLKEGDGFIENGQSISPNIGGDRVSPCSDNYFETLTGSRRLADQWINNGPYCATIIDNGVQLESPVSPLLGVKLIRTIHLEPNTTKVIIEQELIKVQPARSNMIDTIPLTIWNLSQIRPPKSMWVPLQKKSVFKNGFDVPAWPDALNHAADNIEINNNLLKLNPITENNQKIGIDADGWVAGLVDNVLMVQRFNLNLGLKFPDGGTNAAIFSNAEFAELECLSPEKVLKPGESIKHTIIWELHRINHEKELNIFLIINKSN
jgi:hypothetical protein